MIETIREGTYFPIRISEVEMFLRGPDDEGLANGAFVSTEVAAAAGSGDLIEAEVDRVHEVEMGGVNWHGNGLWDGQSHVLMLDVPVAVIDEQAVDGAGGLQSPEEKLQAQILSRRWRQGHPRKADFVSPEIADISLSDLDLKHRNEALIKEAAATVDLGKLLRVKTIGYKEVIVQDIAQIHAQSQ
ncbi:hypothetical protein V6N11_036783 [Hibiscus sabdariffa]|uniref:Uncharacterized protein n=1 Tax=Hibiscus sabdariffa TaxID=183260 RepID=A0ABR2RBD2_9ROSI